MILDVIVEIIGNLVLFRNSMKDLQSSVFLKIELSHVLNDFADFRNVVGQDNTREGLDEDQAKSLNIVIGRKITKSNG